MSRLVTVVDDVNRFIDEVEHRVDIALDVLEGFLYERNILLTPDTRLMIQKHIETTYKEIFSRKEYSLQLFIDYLIAPVIHRFYPGRKYKKLIKIIEEKLQERLLDLS